MRWDEAAVIRRYLDRYVEPFLRADCLGKRLEDGPDLLENVLEQASLVHRSAFADSNPAQELIDGHPPGCRPGRCCAPLERRVQQRIELGNEVLDLACGNPLRERLEHRVGDLAGRRIVDPQPLADPAPEHRGRHQFQVPVLCLSHKRSESLRQRGCQVCDRLAAERAPEREEHRAGVGQRSLEVRSLALGHPVEELVDVERLGVSLGVDPWLYLGWQLAQYVHGLAARQTLGERLQSRLGGTLCRHAADSASRLLDYSDNLVVLHARSPRLLDPYVWSMRM